MTANASRTYTGIITATTPLGLVPASVPYSTPVIQTTHQINVAAGPGDTISATLTYADTSGGTLGGNDLDLTLLLPSAAPIPIIVPPPDPVGFATVLVTSRVTRATCMDAAAESDNKPLLGEPTSESLSFTVPAGGETGAYALLVRGFLATTDQPYSATVTVTDSGGADVTTARTPALVTLTTLYTTNPHCELI
jgi:hypothetical protein